MAFIPITTAASPDASKLNNSANNGRMFISGLREAKAKINLMVAGGMTWGQIEAHYGIPSGKGETLSSLVSSIIASVDAPNEGDDYDLSNFLAGVGG
jgi:hypothetical protein